MILLYLFVAQAYSEQSPWHENELPSDINTVFIKAHSLDLQLSQLKSKKPGVFKIRYNDNEFDIDYEKSSLIISEEKFPSKEGMGVLGNKKKKMHIQFPKDQSFRISIFEGQIDINSLSLRNMSMSVLNRGNIKIRNTTGDVQVFQGSGPTVVLFHKGSLKIQAEDSVMNIQSSTGSMDLRNLRGQIKVSRSSGQLYIRSFKSPVVLKTVTGTLDFLLEKGGLYLQGVTGSVRGYSKEGEIRGLIRPTNTVAIETEKGRIHLNFPHSRSWVRAESWEGRVSTPPYFNRTKTGGMDRSKGQLRGKKYKGTVSLKSQSGSITVYQSQL